VGSQILLASQLLRDGTLVSSKAWKDFEDRVCKQLGGRRILGNRGSGVPDCDERVPFAVEAKHGYEKFRLPKAWIDQARRNAVASDKPWLIVQAPKHARRPVVTLDFGDFVSICKDAGLIPW
jgi:hypothetical protein